MKKDIVEKYNLTYEDFDYDNPVSLGNGDFCYTADQTGFQTKRANYTIPLSCFTNIIWAGKEVTDDDAPLKYYTKRDGSSVGYMSDFKKENIEKYMELRLNKHKFNLFYLSIDSKEEIKMKSSCLNIFDGKYEASYFVGDKEYKNECFVNQSSNTLKFNVTGKDISLKLEFFSPSAEALGSTQDRVNIEYKNDYIYIYTNEVNYKLYFKTTGNVHVLKDQIEIKGNLNLALEIGLEQAKEVKNLNYYWNMLKDKELENKELERRFVLSLYLLKINTLGSYPPAETGLTMNSWNGKFHLEMHLWHHLGLIYMGAGIEVLKSVKYYLDIFDKACVRAKKQGYKGARYPKMTDPYGLDSPSQIGCLLVWQAPNILVMLNALKENGINIDEYKDVIYNVGLFIESFFVNENGVYKVDKPLITSQECYTPSDVDSPLFETEYLRYGLILANKMLDINNDAWNDIINNASLPKVVNNIYMPDVNDLDHYGKFAQDHPSVVGAYSFFKSDRINKDIMHNTLLKVIDSFDMSSMWGWDFPMMSICAYNTGDIKLANELLMLQEPKNTYLKCGHNKQGDMTMLPIYLPGNGAIVLAVMLED